MKKSRGFTLLEMSVALGIAAVALAILALILTYANAFTKTKQLQTATFQEISMFKQTFENALEDFQSPNFTMQVVENQVVFESAGAAQTISFESGKLWQNETILKEFAHIENVEFSTNQNLINCTLDYGNQTQTLVFFKRI